MKLALSFFTALSLASIVACSATTNDDPSSDDPNSEIQDQELRKSITSCNADSDCVAVARGGCCQNGWLEAVNTHHVQAYQNATRCTANPRPMCPMYMVRDTRVAACDTSAHQCKMVDASPTTSLEGEWGADQAILNVTNGKGSLEFGCGAATIDSFKFSDAQNFTATGTDTPGSGVMFAPGSGPKPQPVSYTGHVSGDTLTLTMTVGTNTSTYTFTHNRKVFLIRCL
jgi:hypothetical protein